MEKYLEGKKVLFIGIGFYDYDKAIKKEIEKAGASVDYFQEFPITFKSRILSKLNNSLLDKLKIERQKKILSLSKDNYDYIFVIKGETLKKEFLEKLKNKNKNAKFIMYQWDSIRRVENYREIESCFDRKLSFDRIDTLSEKDLEFLPLFYRELPQNNEEIIEDIDVSFVGWYHSDRYFIIENLKRELDKKELSSFFYIYIGKFYYYLNYLLKKDIRNLNRNIVKFKPLPYKDYIEINRRSKVILDIAHSLQSGLTMRTIEIMGMNKKIITTNKDIKNYNFYNGNNIEIIERENISIEDSFFENKFFGNDEIKKLEIKNWIKNIFL